MKKPIQVLPHSTIGKIIVASVTVVFLSLVSGIFGAVDTSKK